MTDRPTPVETLHEYYAAFNTHDVRVIVPYFHEPTLLLAPQGSFAAASHTDLTPAIAGLLDGLRARGFARSELSVRRVDILSATAALVTGVAIRYTAAGPELERAGLTYVLNRTSATWKIAALIAHDVEPRLAVEP